ncbi:SDR family oxidoreductase [Cellulomonas aerilata]|uniref:SDR family oxidoreductase n=1 Tax=Cellulomonas aerilata TaxID=515326 RepID=UPI001649DA63|nr:SDR family oxidoreductase [Cellulomonas aerilata]
MILVVGATGLLGGLIAHRLLEQGHRVRALVRGGPGAAELRSAGAELVTGDLKDPASLRAACAGVESVVTTANSAQRGGADTPETVERRGNVDLIDAAVASGVEHFVLVSALGADAAGPDPFLRGKGEAEDHLRGSRTAWTILRPNIYLDIWVPAVVGPALAGQPVTLVGEGRRRHSMVSVRDVAAYAVAALDPSQRAGRTLVIGGPEPVSWRDVVALAQDELGRELDVRTVAPGEPVPGLPPVMSGLLALMDTYDSPIDMTELSGTSGIAPTPARTVVQELVRTTASA